MIDVDIKIKESDNIKDYEFIIDGVIFKLGDIMLLERHHSIDILPEHHELKFGEVVLNEGNSIFDMATIAFYWESNYKVYGIKDEEVFHNVKSIKKKEK